MLIYNLGCIPRQKIVTELELSLPTITQNLNDLITEGLIKEKGSFGNTGGRRARGYSIVPDSKLAIGVDINKKHFSIVIIDLLGDILVQLTQYRDFSNSDDYYKCISKKIDEIVADNNIDPEKVLGVGIAIQGIVSADNRVISYGEILDITGETIDRIGQYVEYPKALFHDSDMAAFAENKYSADGSETVYISLSTNLGGAINGPNISTHSGDFGRARIEHMTLIPNGKPCYCGQLGCADAYCSTSALTDVTEDGRLETFFKEMKDGNQNYIAIWDDYLDKLSIVINNTRMMYDCNIVLGGYMGKHMDEYMESLKEKVYSRNSFEKNNDYLHLCRVKIQPVAVGAALQYVEEFIRSV